MRDVAVLFHPSFDFNQEIIPKVIKSLRKLGFYNSKFIKNIYYKLENKLSNRPSKDQVYKLDFHKDILLYKDIIL